MADEVGQDRRTGPHHGDDFADYISNIRDIKPVLNKAIETFAGQDAYEKHLLDMNNTSKDQIRKIWENVNTDANTYLTKFSAIGADLEGFTQQLANLTSTVTGSGTFDTDNIKTHLTAEIASYNTISKYYEDISGAGLTAEEISKNPNAAIDAFKAVAQFALDNAPTLKANGSWSMPIGPGLLLTIALHEEADGNGNLTITIPESVFKGQKTLLKDMLSWNEKGVNVNKDGVMDTEGWVLDTPMSKVMQELKDNGHITEAWHKTVDGVTETLSLDLNVKNQQVKATAGVKQDVTNGSASTDITLETVENSGWRDPRLPAPAYAVANEAAVQEWYQLLRNQFPQINPDFILGVIVLVRMGAIAAMDIGIIFEIYYHIKVPAFPLYALEW
ncbi:hypothetical protein OZX74_00875 [Bifidobacterium sp. ESL0798]|uniref:hypothetical protein n=1 Tax=Bifidobacterium sp. ESL0798 TaxID=2983235 RepID=UPI0023F6401A|nr:hypothetical protein [Bifidobacterium sp. ESL0798]WEV74152.1 hypothetical protein OZX74_00875 [Bifidobacterium sp. ESL0798]